MIPARLARGAALALVLAVIGGTGLAKDKKDDSPAVVAARDFDRNPYPSTYRIYPGVPTLIVGATVFDGEGGRIEKGQVLIRDGKIAAVAGPMADMDLPSDVVRIDGTGKFVTPGIIDVHSHLGVYPSPSVEAHSDGNEATAPTTPEVWAEHSVWPQDPGFSRARPTAG